MRPTSFVSIALIIVATSSIAVGHSFGRSKSYSYQDTTEYYASKSSSQNSKRNLDDSAALMRLRRHASATSQKPMPYIIRFKDDSIKGYESADHLLSQVLQKSNDTSLPGFVAKSTHRFKHVFNAAGLELSTEAVDWLEHQEEVMQVVIDHEIELVDPVDSSDILDSIPSSKVDKSSSGRQLDSITSQSVDRDLWNLDRIDDRSRELDGTYQYSTTGSGVDVYVVDTGINAQHNEFGDRVTWAPVFAGDGRQEDCDGHGTHVAGIVGGRTVGVAKDVHLFAVKTFSCDTRTATTGNLLQAFDWVRSSVNSRQRPSVVNLSLGGPADPLLDSAVQRLHDDGIVVVVAAGNNDCNSCESSPARAPSAITVGATTIEDDRASYSNTGPCVDIYAPGSEILSTWYTSNSAGAILSGTSMASPHVAGSAARYLQDHNDATPDEVAAALLCATTSGAISDIPNDGSVETFLYMNPSGTNPVDSAGSCSVGLDKICPGQPACNQRGQCKLYGECSCTCGWVGESCRDYVPVQELTGRSGSVSGSTKDGPDYFGMPAPEKYFAIAVGTGATRLTISLCSPTTNFDTVMWLLNRCFNNQITDADVLESNDDAASGSCPEASLSSRIVLQAPPADRYYILVEGYGSESGNFKLSYTVDGVSSAPSPSPSPEALPSPEAYTEPRSCNFGNGALRDASTSLFSIVFAMACAMVAYRRV